MHHPLTGVRLAAHFFKINSPHRGLFVPQVDKQIGIQAVVLKAGLVHMTHPKCCQAKRATFGQQDSLRCGDLLPQKTFKRKIVL